MRGPSHHVLKAGAPEARARVLASSQDFIALCLCYHGGNYKGLDFY